MWLGLVGKRCIEKADGFSRQDGQIVDRSSRVRVARPSRESGQPAKEMAGRPNRNRREGLRWKGALEKGGQACETEVDLVAMPTVVVRPTGVIKDYC